MSSADLQLLKKGFLNYTQKRKNWVLLAIALGFSGYGAHRVYQLPSVVKKRKSLSKLFGALISVAELVSHSAEAIGIVSNDLKHFIQSDSDRIPNSLKQLSKIAKSNEFSDSLIGITRALTLGIYRGYRSESNSTIGGPSFSDRAFDKLFSKAGSGFASAVVGSFAKNLVMGAYLSSSTSGDHFAFDPQWADVICGEKFKELIGDCIQVFVSTAVAVYLDKTMHINTCEELFSGLTNPKHEMQVRELMALVCNGAVETLVKTSHQVLTSPNSNSNSDYSDTSRLYLDLGKSRTNMNEKPKWRGSMSSELRARKPLDGNGDGGWVNKMSNTLAVPSNRRFVLDMTGKVTFETVRSFLEFLLERLSEGLKRNLDMVHEEVVDRGIEALRYMTVKSSAVVTLCLSLCLHILGAPWVLVPA
ncbi:hypothetical protein LguiA_006016 [Lonicera macranthoides]